MHLTDPTKGELLAAAGWTLVKRATVHDSHANALDRFRDGCVGLAEHTDETRRGVELQTSTDIAELPKVTPPRAEPMPDDVLDVLEAIGQQTCRNGGRHQFHRETRHCKWCGVSYVAAKGRQPELMR